MKPGTRVKIDFSGSVLNGLTGVIRGEINTPACLLRDTSDKEIHSTINIVSLDEFGLVLISSQSLTEIHTCKCGKY